ncbi:hypothetical protein LL969_00305 [Xanthomonas campestris pv. phormiicola]|nr:hypothetical protein [Xanthomonas campestris pv. phormiicola]
MTLHGMAKDMHGATGKQKNAGHGRDENVAPHAAAAAGRVCASAAVAIK